MGIRASSRRSDPSAAIAAWSAFIAAVAFALYLAVSAVLSVRAQRTVEREFEAIRRDGRQFQDHVAKSLGVEPAPTTDDSDVRRLAESAVARRRLGQFVPREIAVQGDRWTVSGAVSGGPDVRSAVVTIRDRGAQAKNRWIVERVDASR